MWIVPAILKWIGIVLGGILGLVLLFGALAAFVPIRYRVRMGSRGNPGFSFRFSWLYPVLAVSKNPRSDKIMLRLFGIPVRCLAGGRKKKRRPPKREKGTREQKGRPQRDGRRTGRKIKNEEKGKKKGKKKKSFSIHRLSSIIGLAGDGNTRLVARRLRRELALLVRYLCPTKIRGTVIIGTGDPALTGLLIGGISLLPIVYRKGVRITPDFERKRFEAEGYAGGRVRIIYFIRLIARLYADQELKQLWRQIYKVKKEAA